MPFENGVRKSYSIRVSEVFVLRTQGEQDAGSGVELRRIGLVQSSFQIHSATD